MRQQILSHSYVVIKLLNLNWNPNPYSNKNRSDSQPCLVQTADHVDLNKPEKISDFTAGPELQAKNALCA